MFLDSVAYTDDGRAVISAENGTHLISVFEIVDFTESDSRTILRDLDYLHSWIKDPRVRLADPVLVRTAPTAAKGKNIEIISAFTGSLEEFIEVVERYGEFTGFAAAPAARVTGWEVAKEAVVREAYRNLFREKRVQAVKNCIMAGDPHNLFTTAS